MTTLMCVDMGGWAGGWLISGFSSGSFSFVQAGYERPHVNTRMNTTHTIVGLLTSHPLSRPSPILQANTPPHPTQHPPSNAAPSSTQHSTDTWAKTPSTQTDASAAPYTPP